MNARSLAIANETRQIEESAERAAAAARPRTALEALAFRLNVSPGVLQKTLKNTVFKGCSDDEFVALVIVSNEYNLNPILREIYAMPKKGGGIQAIVGYDGWIKIANAHPQYDGIEFNHIEDNNGNVKAIEGVLYRKDRNHPTKKMVYLKEFKRNTDPWNNSPHHMLDVRCFCQTVRLGLGVALGIEGDENLMIDGGDIRPEPARSLPSRQSLGEELGDEIPSFDEQTGEVIEADPNTGMTVVTEEMERELSQSEVAEQTAADIDGPLEEERPAWADKMDELRKVLSLAKSKTHIKAIEDEYKTHAAMLPSDTAKAFEDALSDARLRVASAVA